MNEQRTYEGMQNKNVLYIIIEIRNLNILVEKEEASNIYLLYTE